MLALAQAVVPVPRPDPLPPPGIRIVDLRADEKPVAVEKSETVVSENAFFRRVRTTFAFTNPNSRAMSGELEFPIPDGAFVCGYALEVNGEMVPGVVCEKEKARVAFENEVRKGVDPGIVEQVKGNVWKTRIFPLNPRTPRKAEVEYVAPKTVGEDCIGVVLERDGDDCFMASVSGKDGKLAQTVRGKIAAFAKGAILWDASLSAKAHAAEWRKKLESLPEKGEWYLVAFRNVAEAPRSFTDRDSLVAAVDTLDYDGGTDLDVAKILQTLNPQLPTSNSLLLFTDEVDTLGLSEPKYEGVEGLVVASRDDAPARTVEVRKLNPGEEKLVSIAPVEGKLLATAWCGGRATRCP